jgi:hypothetical protein
MEGFYGLPYDRFEKWSPAGSSAQLADFLIFYVASGFSVFSDAFWGLLLLELHLRTRTSPRFSVVDATALSFSS